MMRARRNMLATREAAEVLGVSVSTLQRWEKQGRLAPDTYTPGGHRRYDETRLRRLAAERRSAPGRRGGSPAPPSGAGLAGSDPVPLTIGRYLARGRLLVQDLHARGRADPEGCSALLVIGGGAVVLAGALMAVGDAATLMLGLLLAGALAALGRGLEPSGGREAFSARSGEGPTDSRRLLAYVAALGIAGYVVVQMLVSVALILAGALLLRAGWIRRGERAADGLLDDARRILRGAEADVRRALDHDASSGSGD